MKTTTTLFFILIVLKSFATVKTTVSNGDWFNPAIWSPSGVPLMEDTVIINHAITASDNVDYYATWMIVNGSLVSDSTFGHHGNLKLNGTMNIYHFASGDGDSALIYGTLSGSLSGMGNPVNINYGTVNCDTLSAGDNFDNRGWINVAELIAGGPTFINRSGAAINVSTQAVFSTSSISTIELNSTMVTSYLITGCDMVNNGDVSCGNWTHGSGTISGTTGKFCIQQCFVNNSTITGTVDVCDATPGSFCDVNMGTISPTVTNCTVGPCSNNAGLEEQNIEIGCYPNPAQDFIAITGVSGSYLISIYGMNGSLIKQINHTENENIDIRDLTPGIYFLKINDGEQNYTMKFHRGL